MVNNNITTAAMPKDLKYKNRKKILDVFRNSDELTINEITNQTGISRQTVVKSISHFIEQELVMSIGKGHSTQIGGKKPEIYKFNKTFKYLICVRFEYSTIIIAVSDLCGNIINKIAFSHIPDESLDIIISKFTVRYSKLILQTKIDESQIYGLSISISGIYNQETGIMRYNSFYPSWGTDVPIAYKFKKVLPKHYEFIIENDAKITGTAELFNNNELENKKAVVLYTHSGISSAYIENGVIQTGKNSLLGEIGHMTVDPYDTAECSCGCTGCFEKMVSDESIQKIMFEDKEKYNASLLSQYSDDGITLSNLFELSDSNDSYACEITDKLAFYFSIALKNIILNIDPEIIIIQGKYASAGKYFRSSLKEKMKKFKYYPENAEFDIRYNKSEIWKLALLGSSMSLMKRFFDNDNIYN